VWSWGIVVWEIFNRGALPYGHLTTNAEVMEEVQSGRRLELGKHLEGNGKLATLAALVEESWDQHADARPTFEQLTRKCQKLVEELKAASSQDDGDDTADVLKEIQGDSYAVADHESLSVLYLKRSEITTNPGIYEHERVRGSSSSESSYSNSTSSEQR
jgi:glutamate-1-semialdehyde aminotransferase